ncbi:hypothetical protein BD410DRAFT_791329 [Rickenella mellea]|uniref:SLC41A/MgtE integral membrane domain-containing protein n=1 Tax=Rickenella mellea TaxID=50990 RepID=A0A4Y7Q012_9AGAM|nr:hypothetical protein BD410DRAFT_791329 [Rickenella mellea]
MSDTRHLLTSVESLTDSGTIEMEPIDQHHHSKVDNDEVTVARGRQEDDENDNESDSASDHEALLGLDNGRVGDERGWSRSEYAKPRTWDQVRDIVVETAPTLLFTTVGLLFTGELLDHVSQWRAMTRVDELIIIIPVILNLKGNLEMNLSARLGTSANMGHLDDRESRYKILLGNLALLQVQSTLVSFIAACVSFVIGLLMPHISKPAKSTSAAAVVSALAKLAEGLESLPHPRRPRPPLPNKPGKPKSGIAEFILVASTAMCSASLSSLLLGSFMCALVVLCRRFKLNPDNIAPPIASCLGDLITLCLLGLVSTALINFVNTPVPAVVVVILVLSACTCAAVTLRNSYVRDLIRQGWTPLFGAMFISSATGIILDLFVSRYSGFALLAVVISGLPGAVGSIFVSRLSTTLHEAAAEMKSETNAQPSIRTVMTTLMLITIPIEIAFLATLRSVGWLTLPVSFVCSSVIFFCGAVSISLCIALYLTNYLWSKGRDPDVYALPIHSSLVDLVGQLLLVLNFEIFSLLGGKVKSKRGH